MHRLRSEELVRRYRLASLLWIFVCICLPVTIGLLGYGIYEKRHDFMYYGLGSAGLGLFLMMWFTILSNRLRCPLCMVQPLSRRGCAKNRNAGKLLGSYRLMVAASILVRDHFRCPYCGEPTAMEVRSSKKARG
jgi:hypothetical protein